MASGQTRTWPSRSRSRTAGDGASVTADGQGRFRLVTDLPVRPGDGVRLDARGDRGSVRTTIASVPRPMPWDGIDLAWALAGTLGAAIVLLGGALLRSRAGARPNAAAG